MNSIEVAYLNEQIVACNRCTLRQHAQQVVTCNGSWEGSVMLVGEAPGKVEDSTGKPFVGSSGRFLRAKLREAGIEPDNLLITNTCKCKPPGCRMPLRAEQLQCSYWLHRQIDLFKPTLIITAGGVALNQLTTEQLLITKVHGKLLSSINIFSLSYPIFPLYHPAAVLRQQSRWLDEYKSDIAALRSHLTI